nr:MAG: tyrosine recombinase [Metapenaeus ensis nimavirus]
MESLKGSERYGGEIAIDNEASSTALAIGSTRNDNKDEGLDSVIPMEDHDLIHQVSRQDQKGNDGEITKSRTTKDNLLYSFISNRDNVDNDDQDDSGDSYDIENEDSSANLTTDSIENSEGTVSMEDEDQLDEENPEGRHHKMTRSRVAKDRSTYIYNSDDGQDDDDHCIGNTVSNAAVPFASTAHSSRVHQVVHDIVEPEDHYLRGDDTGKATSSTALVEDEDIVCIVKRREGSMKPSKEKDRMEKILKAPEADPNKPTCIICNKQSVKLKRHIKLVHKITGKALEEAYSEAIAVFKGVSLQNCNICSRGVRHMKYHLENTHKLIQSDNPQEYKTALGTNSARLRTTTQRRRSIIRERREGLAKVPVSVQAWIAYESRGGLTTADGKRGMLRNIKLVIEILKSHSMDIMNLIEAKTAGKSYEILYSALLNERKYKHMSISVLLGHLKRFLDWACAEANASPICEKANLEHMHYIRLCRKLGNRENMERKAAEYVPSIEEMAPLIQYSKHRHIINGLIEQPRETLEEYGSDLVHATLAWPLIIKSGARTGVIQNLLTDEVQKAILLESPNGAVIKVKNHKTSLQYGPYQLGVTTREHKMLLNFIGNRDWKSEYVFSSRKGSKFSMANIQRIMKKLFELYGLPRLRIATIRKFLTTQAHKEGNDRIQEATASLLKHSMKTAKRDYKAMQQDHDALNTANHLSRMLQERIGGRCDGDDSDGDDPAEVSATSTFSPVEDLMTTIASGASAASSASTSFSASAIGISTAITTTDVASASASTSNTIATDIDEECRSDDGAVSSTISAATDGAIDENKPAKAKKQRYDCRFKPTHLALIKKVFHRNIVKQKNAYLTQINERREELEEIFAHGSYDPKTLPKKIYESIRSQIRLRQNRV